MQSDIAGAVQRLSAALREAYACWLPVQFSLIEELEDGIFSSSSRNDPHDVLELLKLDPAIYASILRQLGSAQGTSETRIIDTQWSLTLDAAPLFRPTLSAEHLSGPELLTLLAETRRLGATHSLSDMEEFQAMLLEEVTVSCVCAEALAFAVGIDPEAAFSTALLRMLGKQLAAWNFPKEVRTAFLHADSQQSLETRLTQALGFAPDMFNSLLLLDWGIEPTIAAAVRMKYANHNETWDFSEALTTSELLSEICALSELLAQMTHLEQNQSALKRWPALQEAINGLLGPYALQLILEQAREKLLRFSPHAVSLPIPPILHAMQQQIAVLERRFSQMEENEYLNAMPSEPRRRIRQFYRSHDLSATPPAAYFRLLDEVAPTLGFDQAALYVLDTDSARLQATYVHGQQSTFPQSISIARDFGEAAQVATAFRLKALVSEARQQESGLSVTIALPVPGAILGLRSIPGFFEGAATDSQLFARGLAKVLEHSSFK